MDRVVQPAFPLADMQAAYWVGESGLLDLSTTARFYFEIDAEGLPPERIEAAWQCLIARHDSLRACITSEGLQRVLAEVPPYRLLCHESDDGDPKAAEEELDLLRAQMQRRVLPVSEWPQFDLRFSRFGTSRRLHFAFNLWMLDAASFQILLRELLALVEQPASTLPAVTLTPRDYLEHSQEASLVSGDRDKAWTYWRERLPRLPLAPNLPLARSPAAIGTPVFAHLTHRMDCDTWRLFQRGCAAVGVTANIGLLAAYAEVVARWSGEDHFLMTVLHARPSRVRGEAAHLVGNFSTTLLLEVDRRDQRTLQEQARSLQAQLWRDLAHATVSGIEVARELQTARGGQSPLVAPIAFTSVGADRAVAKRIRHLHSRFIVPQVFIDHQAIADPSGDVDLNWDYVDGLFPPGMVSEMFRAYVALVKRLAADPGGWRDPELEILLAAHLAAREQANRTDVQVPDSRLEDLFVRRAAEMPDQVAVRAGDVSLTYGEVDLLSRSLARRLEAAGVAVGARVGVAVPKGWEQVVAVLGILRAGAAYVPLDPALPVSRRQMMVRSCGVQLVVTGGDDAGAAEQLRVKALQVERTWDVTDEEGQLSVVDASAAAYVIFTSGTTGVPKGVEIDHRGAVNTILDINRRFSVSPTDRILAVSSLSFDLSVYDIFGGLAAGATVVIPVDNAVRDPSQWVSIVRKERITVWNSVPALMQLLVEQAAGTWLESLRLVLLSGDWIPVKLPAEVRNVSADARVISLGGATEASIWSIVYPIDTVDDDWASIPYGRPLDNQRWFVLDHRLRPCPTWVPGDLYIGGVGVMVGYVGDDELNASKLIRHPETGERLYRTGDRGRIWPSGDIEFLGRTDRQVKIQGFRVETSEIEAVLSQHPAVHGAVVQAVGERGSPKRLVAYVVCDDQETAEQLDGYLREQMPEYMVPSAILRLPRFPLTRNGKIDRAALPSPQLAAAEAQAIRPTPPDDNERRLIEIWSSILNVSEVGVRDSFFALGGTSFDALRVMARIGRQFGRELPIATLLAEPTVEALARRLSEHPREDATILVPMRNTAGPRPIFCVHPIGGNVLCYAELVDQLGPEWGAYGLQAAGLTGRDALEDASVEELADRYVRAVRRVQPRGPYVLVGWSFGGLVALEMARALSAAGEPVERLVLIDAAPSTAGTDHPADLYTAFARDIEGTTGRPGWWRSPRFEGTSPRDVDEFVQFSQQCGLFPADLESEKIQRLFAVFQANARALARYRPRPYEDPVALVCAAEQVPVQLEAWGILLANMHAVAVPATNHYTLLRHPGVRAVVQAIKHPGRGKP